ncbi:hypothetical protein [Micromonospora sp. KC721]|uniref:hypothetical protein n=1 Tax=Micromonospora sp. KC721 TaxID=2530380 RepID=UPI0010486644|nr:hypothetical protein [Micromonospora sp. KC721]TDB71318.1 hypothetical protein E1182_25405 [Micromonospora sp. KC721]
MPGTSTAESGLAPTGSAQAPAAGRTYPPSPLCHALDLAAAQRISPSLKFSAQLMPQQGEAPDACSYAADDGTLLLSLASTSRPYETEVEIAAGLVRDPKASQMKSASVRPLESLGVGAFAEVQVPEGPPQTVTFVVWQPSHHVHRGWVLSLAQAGTTTADHSAELFRLAQSIHLRLPDPPET